MHFIDEAKIYLKAGDGGNGCVSFRREKFIDRGGPDGGNGGRGASIIFRASADINTLIDFRYKQHFKAPKGRNGSGRKKAGASGKDMVIVVPVGTQIISEDGDTLIMDMNEHGQEFIILEGGRGGAGNAVFKSSTNQAPEKAMPGVEGEEMWVWLKLKLLSDVGLVGLPNAGKSTLLSVVTSAKPKIADYPFTTLKPQLGVVKIGYDEFVIADIPGLIEGASEGHGLGDKFLKHIERCKILLHLIDATDDVINDYDTIRYELENYSQKLLNKTEIIALNKIDLLDEEQVQEKKAALEKHSNSRVLLCSGATRSGLDPLIKALLQELQNQ
jgi:GTP-binding protein